jgi:hypothetical protein
VPALQALTYSLVEEAIREMFANLMAADMNSDRKGDVHPAFVELIKEMTPLEAQILRTLKDGPRTEFVGQVKEGSKSTAVQRTIQLVSQLALSRARAAPPRSQTLPRPAPAP